MRSLRSDRNLLGVLVRSLSIPLQLRGSWGLGLVHIDEGEAAEGGQELVPGVHQVEQPTRLQHTARPPGVRHSCHGHPPHAYQSVAEERAHSIDRQWGTEGVRHEKSKQ